MVVNSNPSQLKLSVCVVTYNQEDYIAECIRSLVEQKTSFSFEIIIGDDCSTDTTSDIVQEFADKYPSIIKLLNRDKNVGAAQNFIDVHEAAIGQFIAHIDGDDYALPGKLQTQVEYMEENPHCNLTWHRMLVERGGKLKLDFFDINLIPENGFSRADILKYITIGMNSSKMYRAGTFDFKRPDFPVLDYFANVEQIGDGYANFVSNEPLGVYRAGIGISASNTRIKIVINETFRYFLSKYPNFSNEINQAVLVLLLASIKNFRCKEVLFFGKTYFLSFSYSVLFGLTKELKFIKMLKLP